MKPLRSIAPCIALSLFALGSVASHAATVFQNPWNPAAPYGGAFSQPSQILAGRFMLAENATVNGASWYGTMSAPTR